MVGETKEGKGAGKGHALVLANTTDMKSWTLDTDYENVDNYSWFDLSYKIELVALLYRLDITGTLLQLCIVLTSVCNRRIINAVC